MVKLPLEGIRAVEVGTAWAAPAATQALGYLGAEVIKVDFVDYWQSQGRGSVARPTKEMISSAVPVSGGYPRGEPGKHPWNVWPIFVSQGCNKLGMTVKDLANPKGREIFLRLIKKSDIFIENNHPDTVKKLNLDYDVLKSVKPDIIVVRLPACGLSGAFRSYRTHGTQLDALSGHASLRGYPDVGSAGNPDVFPSDYLGGAYGALAALLALYYRQRTGKGQLIEVAQLESLPGCLGEAMMDYFMNGRVHQALGNRDIHEAAPCGCYPCKGDDEWVNITVTSEEEWEAFKQVLGTPPWMEDKCFANAYRRWQNQDELDKFIKEWTIKHDKYEITHLLQKEGVPAGPVMRAGDSYSDVHLKEREFFQEVTHEDAGTHLYPTTGWKFSKTPIRIRRPPVRFGGDNEYVYKELLGVSDEEYAEFVKEGHISTEPSADIP